MPKLFKRGGFRNLLGQEREPIIPYGPLRSWLADYEPILLKDRPKVFAQVAEIGVPFETKVEIVSQTDWAQGLARGMCSKLFAAAPGTPEYDACVKRVSKKVAEGVLT